MTGRAGRMPWWGWAWPALAWILLIAALAHGVGGAFAAVMAVVLIGTVFAAVHHAEVVAHRIGEPFGTLVLAIAVTVIEVGLIVSITLAPGPARPELARDTVFAAVMLICNGIVGVCLLVGGIRHHEQGFEVQGASAAFAVLVAMATLSLVLPNFSISAPRADVHHVPARLRRRGVAGAVRHVRVRPGDPPSRLLPAAARFAR